LVDSEFERGPPIVPEGIEGSIGFGIRALGFVTYSRGVGFDLFAFVSPFVLWCRVIGLVIQQRAVMSSGESSGQITLKRHVAWYSSQAFSNLRPAGR
jgi:hypothetical protein